MSDITKSIKRGSLNNDYELIKRLGQGGQGDVWKAIRKRDNKTIALKVMPMTNKIKISEINDEISALKTISNPICHPNLICYYGSYYDSKNGKILIEMEYIDGDTLDDYAEKLRDSGEYDKLYKHLLLITKDLIKGLNYIHNKDILHNDIKPNNIMIDRDLTPKFVDFGLACDAHDTCTLDSGKSKCCSGYSGTPDYASPEMYNTDTRYPQSDIWSLAMSLYTSATGKYAYNYGYNPSIRDIFQSIAYKDPYKLETTNQLLNMIVNQGLVRDPAKRITGTEVEELLQDYQ
jgi:serine/threonine protein kinase